MVRDIDPTTKNCMYTADEFIDISTIYGVNFRDALRLLYNVIYRFGSIFDNLTPLYNYV